MNVPAALVVLLCAAVAVVHSQRICYQPGADCRRRGRRPSRNRGRSGWLQAMPGAPQPSIAQLEVAKVYMCKCCCAVVPCKPEEALCGEVRTCPIKECNALILEHAASNDSPGGPSYSAEVLTAALVVRKVQQRQEKAELQALMEGLLGAEDDNQPMAGANPDFPEDAVVDDFESNEEDYNPLPYYG